MKHAIVALTLCLMVVCSTTSQPHVCRCTDTVSGVTYYTAC
jgi:hypothetical protein